MDEEGRTYPIPRGESLLLGGGSSRLYGLGKLAGKRVVVYLSELAVREGCEGIREAEAGDEEGRAARDAREGHGEAPFIAEDIPDRHLPDEVQAIPDRAQALEGDALPRPRSLGPHELRRAREELLESRRQGAGRRAGEGRGDGAYREGRHEGRGEGAYVVHEAIHGIDELGQEGKADEGAGHSSREGGARRVEEIEADDGGASIAQGLEGAYLGPLFLYEAGHAREAHEGRHEEEDDGDYLADLPYPLRVGREAVDAGVRVPVEDEPEAVAAGEVYRRPAEAPLGRVDEVAICGTEAVELLRVREQYGDLGVIPSRLVARGPVDDGEVHIEGEVPPHHEVEMCGAVAQAVRAPVPGDVEGTRRYAADFEVPRALGVPHVDRVAYGHGALGEVAGLCEAFAVALRKTTRDEFRPVDAALGGRNGENLDGLLSAVDEGEGVGGASRLHSPHAGKAADGRYLGLGEAYGRDDGEILAVRRVEIGVTGSLHIGTGGPDARVEARSEEDDEEDGDIAAGGLPDFSEEDGGEGPAGLHHSISFASEGSALCVTESTRPFLSLMTMSAMGAMARLWVMRTTVIPSALDVS